MMRPRKRSSEVRSSMIASVIMLMLCARPAASSSSSAIGSVVANAKPSRQKYQITQVAIIMRAGCTRVPNTLRLTEPMKAPQEKLATIHPRPCWSRWKMSRAM
jgi:hypothetical protein